MNKREFLAMGGAVPLILAGCGGNGTGSAPVRLVNASVGYPSTWDSWIESTQATHRRRPTATPARSTTCRPAPSAHADHTVAGQTSATAAQTAHGQQGPALLAGRLRLPRRAAPGAGHREHHHARRRQGQRQRAQHLGRHRRRRRLPVGRQGPVGLHADRLQRRPRRSPRRARSRRHPGRLVLHHRRRRRQRRARASATSASRRRRPITLTALQVLTDHPDAGRQRRPGQRDPADARHRRRRHARRRLPQHHRARARRHGRPGHGHVGRRRHRRRHHVTRAALQHHAEVLQLLRGQHRHGARPSRSTAPPIPVVMDSTDATTGVTTQVPAALSAGGDYTIMVYLNGRARRSPS